ncbi:MAG: YigZ family protein [Bacteroidota bacterium]|nr:YigZ family protein [Bacteroidota bacterium]
MKGLQIASCIVFFETHNPSQTLHEDHFSYRTITGASEGTYREKGSRFHAFAFPAMTETDIRNHLSLLRKKYFDARHHCYAWVLGADKKSFRGFDDGEPNHSAGDPILGQIRSRDLTNVLVVVVRYFGGIKLGVGGLVTAYKTAAAEALDNAGIIEREVLKEIRIQYDYAATAEVMRLVKEYNMEIKSQSFESECALIAHFRLRDEARLSEKLNLLQATGVKLRRMSVPEVPGH